MQLKEITVTTSTCFHLINIYLVADPLNWTYYGIEIQLFCNTINSQIMENRNCLLTWSIAIIIPYDAIFIKIWWSAAFCLCFQLVKTGSRLVLTGFTQYFIIAREKKMVFSICLSILIQTKTNIVWKNAVRASHVLGLLSTHFYSINGRIQWSFLIATV